MIGTWESRVGMKVCLVGEAGVGKTSLINRFVHDRFEPRYVYTLGITYEVADIPLWLDGREFEATLRIWDIMGERSLRTLVQDSYLDSAHGVLAVCDLTRPETLQGLEDWLALMRQVAPHAELLFLGNKADLTDRARVKETQLAQLASRHAARHLLVSAKDDTDIGLAFQILAQGILERRMRRVPWYARHRGGPSRPSVLNPSSSS